jgi:hypothetical protein
MFCHLQKIKPMGDRGLALLSLLFWMGWVLLAWHAVAHWWHRPAPLPLRRCRRRPVVTAPAMPVPTSRRKPDWVKDKLLRLHVLMGSELTAFERQKKVASDGQTEMLNLKNQPVHGTKSSLRTRT